MSEFSRRTPRLWPYLLLSAAVALFIDFVHIHREEHADALIPVMVSLQRWTFFYWGQDRIGMLLPLLALPFHDPFVNLLIQGWMSIFSALASYFLLARYLCRTAVWPLAATLGSAGLLALSPPRVRFDWLIAQNQYGVSLLLLLMG